MAKTEVKQVPKHLNPYGEKILKIVYDDNTEPPKNYIWCKDEEFYYWNGKNWIPYESEVFNKKHNSCDCNKSCCISDEALNQRFETFKKDVLAAVLKINNGQSAVDVTDIRNQLAEIQAAIIDLQNIDYSRFLTEHQSLSNYYTKSEVDSRINSSSEIVKVVDIDYNSYLALGNNIERNTIYNIIDAEAYHYDPTNINNQLTGLRNRVTGVETNIGSMISDINALKAIDHSQFITTNDLQNALPTVPTKVSELTNDVPYITMGDVENYTSNMSSQIDDIDGRVHTLENMPFDTYLTTEDEEVISASLNNLDNRIVSIENNYATTNWVDENYEPKFTDLTNEADPVSIATSQQHSSDNKVYITEVEVVESH